MKQKLNLVLICSVIISYIDTSYCKFLGGTISWMQDSSTNDLRFTYRLSWEKGTGPCGSLCSPTQNGTNVTGNISSPLLSSLQWTYSDGTTSRRLSDINYYVTSVSSLSAIGWEQGEQSFTVKIPQAIQPYVVFFESIPWVDSGADKSSSLGYMETSVNPQIRSDTGKINASPYSSLPSYLGVAFGCTTTVRLPADDPDGDSVRCRWAEQAECKNACTNSPNNAIKLSKANCTLTINAFSETGFAPNATYRLAIVVEDFSHGLILVGNKKFARDRPLSRIPLQLTLTISGDDCKPIYINPFSLQYYRYTYELAKASALNSFITLETDDFNSTEIMASIPRRMNYTIKLNTLASQLNGKIYTTVSYALVPTPSQYGYMQLCFWVQREDSVTINAACKVETVADQDLCRTGNFTCKNNGSCVNIFNVTNEICDCPAGYKPPDCFSEIQCADKPCENSGSCQLNKSKTTCSCLNGFNGYYCEQEPHYCASSPCNNNGTCLELQNRHSCLCLTNFTGINCDSLKDDSDEDIPTRDQEIAVWIPVTASVGGLAALVGASICIYKFKPSDTDGRRPTTNRIEPIKSEVTELKPVNTQGAEPKSLNF